MAQTFTVASIEEAADVLFAVVDEHLDKAFASLA
jgi:hypothetical protein